MFSTTRPWRSVEEASRDRNGCMSENLTPRSIKWEVTPTTDTLHWPTKQNYNSKLFAFNLKLIKTTLVLLASLRNQLLQHRFMLHWLQSRASRVVVRIILSDIPTNGCLRRSPGWPPRQPSWGPWLGKKFPQHLRMRLGYPLWDVLIQGSSPVTGVQQHCKSTTLYQQKWKRANSPFDISWTQILVDIDIRHCGQLVSTLWFAN